MKKITSILLIVILSFSILFTGCSEKKGEVDKTNQDVSNVKELKLSVMIPNFGKSPIDTPVHKEWQKRTEEYLDLKLDIDWNVVPYGEYDEKYKLQLASGEIPDILTSFNEDTSVSYGQQGLLLDISKYLDECPYYKKYIDATSNADKTLFTPEGNLYLFCEGFINDKNNEGTVYGSLYRFDIFKKHNIKLPETIEEFYEAAVKLKELYPDIYPVNSLNWPEIQEGFYMTYHASNTIFWNGNEFKYGPLEKGYKKALQFLNKLYQNKLLDPEFITQSDDMVTEKATTGKSFIFPAAYMGFDATWNEQGPEGMEWGGALPPTDKDEAPSWLMYAVRPGRELMSNGIVVSAKTEYPKLVTKMLDYQYEDGMVEMNNWGVLGDTYEKDENGNNVYTKKIVDANNPSAELEPYGTLMSGSCRGGIPNVTQDFMADIGKYKPMAMYLDGKYMNGNVYELTFKYAGKERVNPNDRSPRIKLSKEEQSEKSEILTAIDTYRQEMEIKFITGEKNFEEFDAYLEQLKKIGDYTKIIEMMNSKLK